MKTLEQAHSHKACYYGERPDWLIVLTRTRDSDCLEQSNFESALAALGGEGEHVAVERSSHWAVGWVEYLVVAPPILSTDPAEHVRGTIVAQAEALLTQLEDYPVLDEEDMSRREYEDYVESWDSWGRSDYRAALKSRLFDGYNEESARLDALKEACDDLTDEQLDALVAEARQSVNWEYQAEGSGVTINITGLAEATDIDALIEQLDEMIAEDLRVADIKRLAFYLGASPAEAKEAATLNLQRVTDMQALMQGSI